MNLNLFVEISFSMIGPNDVKRCGAPELLPDERESLNDRQR